MPREDLKKVLFVTARYHPIHCGVGTYTQFLAESLVSHNVELTILTKAYKDLASQERINGVIINRIEKFKFKNVKEWMKNRHFDWCFIQYVPYSFSDIGIHGFWYLPVIKVCSNLGINFHELWIGYRIKESLFHQFIGTLQKVNIKLMLTLCRPDSILTSNEYYRYQLNSINSSSVSVVKFEVFSNIRRNNWGKKNKFSSAERSQYVLWGTFYSWQELSTYLSSRKAKGKMELILIGQPDSEVQKLKEKKIPNLRLKSYGRLEEEKIAKILFHSTHGISSAVEGLEGKSGVVASYRLFDLQIVFFPFDRIRDYIPQQKGWIENGPTRDTFSLLRNYHSNLIDNKF